MLTCVLQQSEQQERQPAPVAPLQVTCLPHSRSQQSPTHLVTVLLDELCQPLQLGLQHVAGLRLLAQPVSSLLCQPLLEHRQLRLLLLVDVLNPAVL
jgi:hypothetical protein